MRILVTGGAGFIGSHIVDAYIREGHEVSVIDNLSTGNKDNLNPCAKFYLADIRDDLSSIIHDIRPEIISHHAAQVDVRASVENPAFDANANIIGTINLVENGLRNGLKKFIFASSGGAIYGEQEYFPADEEHPLRPVSPYGVSKLAAEKYLYYYKYNFGLDYVALRYANVYGPRQNHLGEAGVVAIFTYKLLNSQHPIVNGDGKQTRDYIFVEDVVSANMRVVEMNVSGEFNIGTGVETSVNELFGRLIDVSGCNTKAVYGPQKKGEQRRSCLSYKKAKDVLGWAPSVGLSNGLRKTYEWFLNKNK